MFNTPILFIVFNRPEETQRVFEAIRVRKPKHLFIAADGPRINNHEDIQLCEETRKIVSNIDWECDIKTLYRNNNIGCGLGVSTAISWFFSQVDEGIILEDDCLPNESFFKFCSEMLKIYREDRNIMMVCGTSYQQNSLNHDTYYFSKYIHIWGWATWKRAWNNYSYHIEQSNVIEKTFKSKREQLFWKNQFSLLQNGLDTWDYQWMHCIWKNNGLSIIPWKNLIANIGFGLNATHTFDIYSDQSNMVSFELKKITLSKKVKINSQAERFERESVLIGSDYEYYYRKFTFKLKKLIKLILK